MNKDIKAIIDDYEEDLAEGKDVSCTKYAYEGVISARDIKEWEAITGKKSRW